MNNKKIIARVGNFIITRENGNDMDWASIKAVSGFWTLRFREDNQMYHTVVMLCENDNLHAYLEGWINSVYVLGNTTPDLEFFEAFYNAFDSMNNRKKNKPVPEEEDKEILKEMQALEEMKEDIKKGDAD